MPPPPICTKCKNVSLRFNDDGTGFCNFCSRTFVWNRPGASTPPRCRRCKTHSLSFMPEGYGWCTGCFNKFIWKPGVDIDLANISIPQSPRLGGQPSFTSGEYDIQSTIFKKKGGLSYSGFIKDSEVDFEGDAIILSVFFDNVLDHAVNEVVVKAVFDQKLAEVDEKEIMVPVLPRNEEREVSFRIWPKGGVTSLRLHAEVRYFNPHLEEYMLKNTEKHDVKISIPRIRRSRIPENTFHQVSRRLLATEQEYGDIKLGGETLFEIMKDMLEAHDMYLLPPRVRVSENLFTGLQRAFAEDDEGEGYQCVIEVMGGPSRSKVLAEFRSPAPEKLLGFSSLLKDGIEKRIDTTHLGSDATVVQQHFHGDYVSDGASKVAIHDSVVQRSNIGADVSVNEGVGEAIQWLDERNQDRTDSLKRGQISMKRNMLEIKGMTEDLVKKMERHFGELVKDLPVPASIEKKHGTLIMEYRCSRNGEHVGTVKDRQWMRWVHFALGAAMVGAGVATFSAELGTKGIRKIYTDLTGKPLDDMPKESMFLTGEERDDMLTKLRESGVLAALNYCPACRDWVCADCFDNNEMFCLDHVD